MGKFLSAEECNEPSEKYTSTADAYTDFLEGSISIKGLVNVMEDLHLEVSLHRPKQYLHQSLLHFTKELSNENFSPNLGICLFIVSQYI